MDRKGHLQKRHETMSSKPDCHFKAFAFKIIMSPSGRTLSKAAMSGGDAGLRSFQRTTKVPPWVTTRRPLSPLRGLPAATLNRYSLQHSRLSCQYLLTQTS